MTRSLVLAATAVAAVFGASAVHAVDYPVNIPENVRLVQKTTVNARTFTKVQSAINDCVAKMGTKLKATNRCVVKVGPGTWNGAIAMRSFVDVEGAGDDTIIVANVAVGAPIFSSTPVTAATVKMAEDSELRDLKVRNASAGGGVGVLFDNVAARLRGVSVEATNACASDSGLPCDTSAVVAQGSAAAATLSRLRARVANTNAVNPGGDSAAVISVRGAKIVLDDASILGIGTNNVTAIACEDGSEAGTGSGGSLVLNDVVAEVGDGWDALHGGDATCSISVRDSVFRATDCAPGSGRTAVGVAGPTTITGSELVGCGCGFQGELVKVSASMVDQTGAPCTYPGAKIVNCWDTNLDAIANQ